MLYLMLGAKHLELLADVRACSPVQSFPYSQLLEKEGVLLLHLFHPIGRINSKMY